MTTAASMHHGIDPDYERWVGEPQLVRRYNWRTHSWRWVWETTPMPGRPDKPADPDALLNEGNPMQPQTKRKDVILTLLEERGPMTRAEIGEALSLSENSVSGIITRHQKHIHPVARRHVPSETGRATLVNVYGLTYLHPAGDLSHPIEATVRRLPGVSLAELVEETGMPRRTVRLYLTGYAHKFRAVKTTVHNGALSYQVKRYYLADNCPPERGG